MQHLDRRHFLQLAAAGATVSAFPFGCGSARRGEATSANKPNIIVIMADDMGFSDIGCYGGEIETPHIDALAGNGLRFRQFYNTARCCPSASRAGTLTTCWAK